MEKQKNGGGNVLIAMTDLRNCTVLDHGEEAFVSAGKSHHVAIAVIVLPPRCVLHRVAEPNLSSEQ